MINLILFGPPGSGKGTQAAKIANFYGFAHISTGDLFRAETTQKTELGLQALEFMSKGQLVPDEITIAMLENKLASLKDVSGCILDGFPRTIPQAIALDALLASKSQHITALLSLEVPEEEIVKRILKRGETSGRPDDNDESIIRKRIQVYLNETAVLFDHYGKDGISHRIPGVGSIENIFNNLCKVIDTYC
jgi:adenylate kinase